MPTGHGPTKCQQAHTDHCHIAQWLSAPANRPRHLTQHNSSQQATAPSYANKRHTTKNDLVNPSGFQFCCNTNTFNSKQACTLLVSGPTPTSDGQPAPLGATLSWPSHHFVSPSAVRLMPPPPWRQSIQEYTPKPRQKLIPSHLPYGMPHLGMYQTCGRSSHMCSNAPLSLFLSWLRTLPPCRHLWSHLRPCLHLSR